MTTGNVIPTAGNNDPAVMFANEEVADAAAANLPPLVRPRPRLVALSEELLLKLGKAMSVSQITVGFVVLM